MKGIEGDIQLKIMQMKRLDSIDSVDKFFFRWIGRDKFNLQDTMECFGEAFNVNIDVIINHVKYSIFINTPWLSPIKKRQSYGI